MITFERLLKFSINYMKAGVFWCQIMIVYHTICYLFENTLNPIDVPFGYTVLIFSWSMWKNRTKVYKNKEG